MTLPLDIVGVSKAYAASAVLKDVSLHVNAAELFGLIGQNGAGKTTLIKLMLDLLSVDAGDIRIFGVCSRQPLARSNLFYVPEKAMPNPNIKGHEYISLALKFYGHSVPRGRMEETAHAFELNPDALNKTFRQCSKGMGQKLALMAAFLSPAQLLVLDEPMSGLDPKARVMVKQQMHEAKEQGRSIFFSSHILADMDEICDRIAVIHDATLRYQGDVAGLRLRYGSGTLEQVFLSAIA